MTVDASRSCLGLATSVGLAIRQIVDARGHQSQISHQLARVGKAREAAQFGDQRCRIDQGHAAHSLSAATIGASVQSGSIASICAVSRSRRASAASTAAM